MLQLPISVEILAAAKTRGADKIGYLKFHLNSSDTGVNEIAKSSRVQHKRTNNQQMRIRFRMKNNNIDCTNMGENKQTLQMRAK